MKLKPIMIVALVLCLCRGFAQKRKVTVDDYALWSETKQEELSPDGKWIAYVVFYDSGLDTLFVKATVGKRLYSFPKGTNGVFSTDGKRFTVTSPSKVLTIIDFETGIKKEFSEVTEAKFSEGGKLFGLIQKEKDTTVMHLIDFNKGKRYTYYGVRQFTFEGENKVALLENTGISLVQRSKGFVKTPVYATKAKLSTVVWDSKGEQLAFSKALPKDSLTQTFRLFRYDVMKQQLDSLDLSKHAQFKNEHIVYKPGSGTVAFSQDGERLFFAYARRRKPIEENGIETWDTMAPLDFPAQQFKGDVNFVSKAAFWSRSTNSVTAVGTKEQSAALFTPDRRYALTYNPLQNQPAFSSDPPQDWYITDLTTGNTKLFLHCYEWGQSFLKTSPNGHYLAYYNEQSWWIYDIAHDRHLNVTEKLGVPFYDTYSDTPGVVPPYDMAGWTNDNRLMVYDKMDIWLITTDGSAERMTRGKESGIRYRVTECELPGFKPYSGLIIGRPAININNGLVLEAVDAQRNSGFFLYHPNRALKQLVFGPKRYNRFWRTPNLSHYAYKEQSATVPARLMITANGSSKMLYQSNSHYNKYEWCTAEQIQYSVPGIGQLKGTLYYPAGYAAGKKYPMVVYVYEKLSQDFHQYLKPSLYDSDGFSAMNYALDGYLVLFPDIRFTIGDTGKSAVACITAAINTVDSKGILDRSRMGLIGHSYGGFIAGFAVTETNIFAAAVAGNGITDLVSHYLSYNKDFEHSNMWRFEYQQHRMGFSLYDNYDSYIQNSPVRKANKIKTPLLLWVGKEDGNVNPNQSMELYMAMRRLGKESILLRYPEEGHLLGQPEHQADLSQRIKAWFDSHLKSVL